MALVRCRTHLKVCGSVCVAVVPVFSVQKPRFYKVMTVPSSSRLRLSIALSGDGVVDVALALLSDPLLALAGRVPLALMDRVEVVAERRLRCGSYRGSEGML